MTDCQLPVDYGMRRETPLCIESGSESSLKMSESSLEMFSYANGDNGVCRKETPVEDFDYTTETERDQIDFCSSPIQMETISIPNYK